MKNRLVRTGIIFLALLIQASFFSVIFPLRETPNLILILAISWTIIIGFEKSLFWIIIAGIITDLVFFKSPGISVIFLVGITYVVSFLSRRFLMENRKWQFLIVAMIIISATILFDLLNLFWEFKISGGTINYLWIEIFSVRREIIVQSIINAALFPIFYYLLLKIENRFNFYDKKMSLK